MPVWPVSLPTTPLRDGYNESRLSGGIRSAMDVGPPKQRGRTTAFVDRYQVTYRMEGSEVDTFWTFWETTVIGGADSFDDWPLPRDTSTLVTARFDCSTVPSITAIGGDLYHVSFAVEVLPT